jgi:glycosyltransferase involved in cell wall biosynthesis
MIDIVNTAPLISVVIPVYNGEKTIMNTLASVLQQTHANFEVIIVDDASEQPVETFFNHIIDNRVKIYRTDRSNANIARNYGISKSKGDYIAMLDADDYWLENHLGDYLELLRKTGADGLYGSLFVSQNIPHPRHIDKNQVIYARKLKDGESMIDYLLKTGYGAQTSTLFTTSHSSKDILWDSKLIDHQDYDFVVRFNKKYRMEIKREPSVIYFLSSGRSSHFETCIIFVKKNKKDVSPPLFITAII